MGLGRVWPRRHDRLERPVLSTQPPHRDIECQGELGLRGASFEHRRDLCECDVCDRRRRTDARDLAVVLHHAKRLHQSARRYEVGRVEKRRPAPLARPDDVIGFETNSAVRVARRSRARSPRLHRSDRGADRRRDHAAPKSLGIESRVIELLFRLRPVPAVGCEQGGAARDDEQAC